MRASSSLYLNKIPTFFGVIKDLEFIIIIEMIGKTIQKIRTTIILIFCILTYSFLMETIFFLTHLIGRNFWWILVSEDVGDFEKNQVKEGLSFPPLEVGSLKAKGFVEISNRLIWFLLCRLHVLNLLKFVSTNIIIVEITQRETE